MENPIKMGWFGGTIIFGNIQMSTHWHHVEEKDFCFDGEDAILLLPPFPRIEVTRWNVDVWDNGHDNKDNNSDSSSNNNNSNNNNNNNSNSNNNNNKQ